MKVDLDELAKMGEQGYVRKVVHPRGHLELFNYTEACTYEGVWNDTTRQCRGLILDLQGNVVARPFAKFFNHGEPNAPELDLDAPVIVTDKMDGSLGILYDDLMGSYAIATRGSFTSEQAIHASLLWNERYFSAWAPPAGVTCLFEIVYPRNRIVVDYGELDDIVLLGARETETGAHVDSRILEWPGLATEEHPYSTLRAALEAPPRPGQEGLVVFFPDSGERVKLKQDDYVAIHRLVFGLTARRVWERCGVHDLHARGLSPKQIGISLQMDLGDIAGVLEAAPDGNWMDEMLQIVPEEFGTWAKATTKRIKAEADDWETALLERMLRVSGAMRPPFERKELALAIQQEPKEFQAALFHLADKKPIRSFAWRAVKPEHETFKPEEGE